MNYQPAALPHVNVRVARDRINAIDKGDLFRVVRVDGSTGIVELEQLDPPREARVIVEGRPS